jgi:glucose/arabinose dehydrogenase
MRLPMPMRFLFLLLCACCGMPSLAQAAPELPPGFSLAAVASQLDFPTHIAWLPDGTMLVLEKKGIVKAFNNGAMQVAADLSGSTNDYWDRGMLGMAVDPDFANKPYLYLNRVFDNNSSKYTGTKTSQLVRITLDANRQMVPGSTVVLVGSATPTRCDDLPVTADCVPADSSTHSVGDVLFGPDGSLYASYGDASEFAFNDPVSLRAQQLDSLAGKVLHIDRNGLGLPGNPFYTGNARDNRSKIFAYGLRNPWRLALNRQTGSVYIADVGSDYFEEINVGLAGANYGWPCYEGERLRDKAEFKADCDTLYALVAQGRARVRSPLAGWLHNQNGAAIVGGTFVTAPFYPASLRGSYIYADYVSRSVNTLRTDSKDKLIGPPSNFAKGMQGSVAFAEGPDGQVYIVQIADDSNNPGTGNILRLDYQAAQQNGDCGAGQFKAEYFNGRELAGVPVLANCEGAPLSHQWGLGSPGAGLGVDDFSVRWTGSFHFDAGDYLFQASSDDGVRVFVDGSAIISGWQDQGTTAFQAIASITEGNHVVRVEYYEHFAVAAMSASWARTSSNNTPPRVSVASPAGHSLVAVGATVNLEGSAVDAEDGPIADNKLQWNVVIQHCAANGCHSHFLQQFTGGRASFTFPDHGNDQYYLEATLIATDSRGLQGSQKFRLDPDRSTGSCPDYLFKGDYFNNKTMSGVPTAIHCSYEVNFSWPTGAPAPGITADNFSARYTRNLPLEAGNYQFTVTGDDGLRFYLDGELLIDAWKDQAATSYTAARTLNAGYHSLRLEYYEATEAASIKLSWTK